MKKLWTALVKFLSKSLLKLVGDALVVADKTLDYMKDSKKDKAVKEAEAREESAEAKIDAACDKGGIDDLFDAAEELGRARKKKQEARR